MRVRHIRHGTRQRRGNNKHDKFNRSATYYEQTQKFTRVRECVCATVEYDDDDDAIKAIKPFIRRFPMDVTFSADTVARSEDEEKSNFI